MVLRTIAQGVVPQIDKAICQTLLCALSLPPRSGLIQPVRSTSQIVPSLQSESDPPGHLRYDRRFEC